MYIYNVTEVSEVWKSVYSYTDILVDNTNLKKIFKKTHTNWQQYIVLKKGMKFGKYFILANKNVQ